MRIKKYKWLMIMMLALIGGACQPPTTTQTNTNAVNANRQPTESESAAIEISPVAETKDGYKVVNSESLKITVRSGAPAQEAQILYRPVTVSDRAIKLKTLSPDEQSNKLFESDLKTPADLNGEIWAQIRYPNGEVKETERLRVAANLESEKANSEQSQNADSTVNTNTGITKTNNEESARSDKITGGKIESGDIQPGAGKISITVNVPAFLMTLWQGNKEIETYYVGVGQKEFPIPVGERSANKIILNPDWIPPDSEWVRESSDVEPYERIPADDPDNPLGKIKIPLGNAYLLHEAQAPSDIGNLVSHGCVRVMRDDIFELTKKISTAQNLDISKQEIENARENSERRVINLNGEIPVDINYDSIVVENNVLSIYPDVYDRKTNTVENLRSELEFYGVDVSKIDKETLNEMLERVSDNRKFVVSLADLKAGNALDKGETKPLTPQQSSNNDKKSES